ncbi:phage tail length tape measure family protein [Stakelama pacifica]|uniref:Phage-related minor tail protein n=1 Tax=Stakelama pacifica TaxID=517720 RepID=A0A4R6G050_9SPHN|nr:phage tail length tape measure family protein [Stakelama pacifica]TDN86834.1 phage-related minor tail protein [Stakelama pacifica]GGO90814.1 hypothetical protein GCM10011329_04050 [Stakelama pacifica]
MAGAKIGSLNVDLTLGTARFKKGLSDAQRQLLDTQKRFRAVGAKMQSLGTTMSIGLTAPFAALMAKAIPAATKASEAIAQVDSALKSMGPVAGYTSGQLQEMAKQLEHTSSFNDKDILKDVTANLLTFGNVAGSAFSRAQQVAVDLSTRLDQDLKSSAIQLGKALNDPVKGLTALSRVGVSFTKEQTAQVKAMMAAGDAASAQNLILTELEKQYGGAAQAARDAAPGSDTVDAWREFQEQVGALALEVLPVFTDMATKVLNVFNDLSPGMRAVVVGGAALAAALGPVLVGLGGLVQIAAPLLAGFGGAGLAGVLTTLGGLLLPIAAAAGAVYLAWKNWDTIGPALRQLGETLQQAFGPTVVATFEALKAAALALWNGPFGDLLTDTVSHAVASVKDLWEQFGPAVISIVKAAGVIVATTFQQISDVINVVAALLHGRWGEAWDYAKKTVADGIIGALDVLRALAPGAIKSMRALYAGVKTWVQDRLGAVWTWLHGKLKAVGGWFFDLYDKVVGHSYIPDMVDAIGDHMARLQGNMVNVARDATEKTGNAFGDLQEQVAPILDRLFPDQAKFNQFKRDLANLTTYASKAGWTEDETSEAQTRLRREYMGGGDPSHAIDQWMADNSDSSVLTEGVKSVADSVNEEWQRVAAANDNMKAGFADMARDVTGSLKGLVSNIKSGDILGALQTVLDLVGQVSSLLGGSFKPATRTYSVGGISTPRANGGPMVPGRTYEVGEHGREWVTVGGMASATPDRRAGQAGRREGGVMEIRLRDELLDARIISGSARVTQAGISEKAKSDSYRASRGFGR